MNLVIEETIEAPIQQVFELFTDLSHAADHVESIKTIEVIGKGPVGKGTRFRETRIMFGKERTEEMEITSFDPPRSYRVEAMTCGAQFTTIYRFEGGQRETRVTMETCMKPVSLLSRVTGPLMGFMMKGSMRKMMSVDHADLKRVAEARAAESAAESASDEPASE